MTRRGPLSSSYAAAAALVVFSLVPYLALTSAIDPLSMIISQSVGLSKQALQLTDGMANAGYAFGTVLAVQLGTRLRPRRLLLLYSLLLVVGSVLAALAPTPGLFIAGHVLQGFCTSLMLIAAVPPLILKFPAAKMPITVGLMNLCIFGAVALGPTIGNLQAVAHSFRLLFWLVAAAAAIGLVFVLATWSDDPPTDSEAPVDIVSLVLSGGGAAAAFFGASELTTHAMLSAIVFIPLLAGVGAIVVLVVHQSTVSDPLVPVRALFSTKPVAGIVAAMAAGAASVPAIELSSQAVMNTGSPADIGALFWPFFGAAVGLAVIFGLVLRTRYIAVLVILGLAVLAGGIAVMTGVVHGPHKLIAFGSGMVGFGVGATVAPGLFMAAFSVVASKIQRVVALVELLRAVAAFLTAPLLLHLAMTVDGGLRGNGVRTALWICFAIATGGGLLSLYLLILGRVKLQQPDLDAWENDDVPAWDSPPLAEGIRRPAVGDLRAQVHAARAATPPRLNSAGAAGADAAAGAASARGPDPR